MEISVAVFLWLAVSWACGSPQWIRTKGGKKFYWPTVGLLSLILYWSSLWCGWNQRHSLQESSNLQLHHYNCKCTLPILHSYSRIYSCQALVPQVNEVKYLHVATYSPDMVPCAIWLFPDLGPVSQRVAINHKFSIELRLISIVQLIATLSETGPGDPAARNMIWMVGHHQEGGVPCRLVQVGTVSEMGHLQEFPSIQSPVGYWLSHLGHTLKDTTDLMRTLQESNFENPNLISDTF